MSLPPVRSSSASGGASTTSISSASCRNSSRNAVGGALAGDALHLVLLLADVLQVDGGDHGDAAVEQFVDILPALRIAAARRIIVGQTVDQADLRMARGRAPCRSITS